MASGRIVARLTTFLFQILSFMINMTEIIFAMGSEIYEKFYNFINKD